MKRSLYLAALLAVSLPASAQFKEVGPAPLPPAAARQKIRTSLEKLDADNRQQTLDSLNHLATWYREIIDAELSAAWKKESRGNLTGILETLADSRVASEIISFSWRERREETFTPAYASLLGHLMARYPKSAEPFLADLLDSGVSGQPPALSPPVAETVCRILVDMPEIGNWRSNALQILPHYRDSAEKLLREQVRAGDPERSYAAQVWLTDLKIDAPVSKTQPARRRTLSPVAPSPAAPQRPHVDYTAPRLELDSDVPSARTPLQPPVQAPVQPPVQAPAGTEPPPYNGPQSGTFESRGAAIPQNAEYIFRDVPPVKIRLDYDTKIWEATLAPGDGQTQRLRVRNKSASPQKKCIVHWQVIPGSLHP